ncbi:unnamed protein product [Pleuronectes platessa]|uniref:Uncharacterized protein n=1 Tax=Pleuronectes platessa TaxID=8262 RepID=A0A9N7VCC3_PLEPL|nr:unnamed protein product [Pleuronectes platessa]
MRKVRTPAVGYRKSMVGRRHRPPVVIISICGDDKVTPGFVSTERGKERPPSQIKESLGFRGDNREELPYEYDHGTPALKTINLPAPSAATPDNLLDIPS